MFAIVMASLYNLNNNMKVMNSSTVYFHDHLGYDGEFYPLELVQDQNQLNSEYILVCRAIELYKERVSEFSPHTLSVLQQTKRLFELDSQIHFEKSMFKYSKVSFLKRFNLPRVERHMIQLLQKVFPQYSWLPNTIPVTRIDVLKQDRTCAKNYIRLKKCANHLDPLTFLKALDVTISNFHIPSGANVTSMDAYFLKMNSNSSAAYPIYKKKKEQESKDQCVDFYNKILSLTTSSFQEILATLYQLPVTTFHRFSPKVKSSQKKVECKIRQVFGYPMGILALQEMLFGQAIDTLLLKSRFVSYAKTRPEISDLVSKLRSRCASRNLQIASFDIKSIDQRLTPLQIYLTQSLLIRSMEYSSSVYDWMFERTLMECLSIYECRTPIIGSWGSVILSCGGTKSGTRLNTIANTFSVELAINTHRIRMSHLYEGFGETGYGLGDDRIEPLHIDDNLSNLASSLMLYHMELHRDKSKLTLYNEPIDYLGMTWNVQNYPTRPVDWIVSKIGYPEKYLNLSFEDRLILRSTSILGQIYNGVTTLMKIIKAYSRKLVNYIFGKSTLVLPYYIKEPTEQLWLNLPFVKILEVGWRLF